MFFYYPYEIINDRIYCSTLPLVDLKDRNKISTVLKVEHLDFDSSAIVSELPLDVLGGAYSAYKIRTEFVTANTAFSVDIYVRSENVKEATKMVLLHFLGQYAVWQERERILVSPQLNKFLVNVKTNISVNVIETKPCYIIVK